MEQRKDYISWDDYFMSIAILSGQRSKDPATQVGACIINDKKVIMGTGYNGLPRGCSDKDYPWGKGDEAYENNKYGYVVHAEMNAIINANARSLDGAKMYVTLFPCDVCAKLIIQSGIKELVYLSDKNNGKPYDNVSKRMLKDAGIKFVKYVPKIQKIVIDTTEAGIKK